MISRYHDSGYELIHSRERPRQGSSLGSHTGTQGARDGLRFAAPVRGARERLAARRELRRDHRGQACRGWRRAGELPRFADDRSAPSTARASPTLATLGSRRLQSQDYGAARPAGHDRHHTSRPRFELLDRHDAHRTPLHADKIGVDERRQEQVAGIHALEFRSRSWSCRQVVVHTVFVGEPVRDLCCARRPGRARPAQQLLSYVPELSFGMLNSSLRPHYGLRVIDRDGIGGIHRSALELLVRLNRRPQTTVRVSASSSRVRSATVRSASERCARSAAVLMTSNVALVLGRANRDVAMRRDLAAAWDR